MPEESKSELVQLQEVLAEFAHKQTRTDENYSFIFLPFDKSESAEDSFRDYLEEVEVNIEPPGVKLEELNEENLGILDVSECLCDWLFRSTRFLHYRQRADELLDAMIHISQATKIWKVDFSPSIGTNALGTIFCLKTKDRFLCCIWASAIEHRVLDVTTCRILPARHRERVTRRARTSRVSCA